MSTKLLQLDNLIEGVVMKRPSKVIKTPYVADIKIGNSEEEDFVLGHTASLGCCGLADVGAHVLMSQVPKAKTNTKAKKTPEIVGEEKPHCAYRVYLSIIREKDTEIIVGIYPKLAEELTLAALKNNHLSTLQNIKSFKRETKIYVPGLVDSRFDLSGIDANGIPFIMEIKNVPLADYEDVCAKDRKKMCFDGRALDSKVAYFPDGYRKKSTDTVSPRALKHINELALIKSMSKTRCIMCYVIQRTDVNRFQPSIIDPEYRAAFIKAREAGVEMITMVVEWQRDGAAIFVKDDLEISV